MPITLSTSSSLADASRIVVAEALETFYPQAPAAGLVRHFELGPGERQMNLERYSRITASALTQGVDMAAPASLANTSVTSAPTEHGAMVLLTDMLLRRSAHDMLHIKGRLLGGALARLQDQDVIGLYDGSGQSIPGAGVGLIMNDLRRSFAYITADRNTAIGPAPGPYYTALHPEGIADLVDDLTPQVGNQGLATVELTAGVTVDVLREYIRGFDKVYNFAVYAAPNITVDASDDAKGVAASVEAYSLVMEGEFYAEDDRDASLRATETIMVGKWNESELVDDWTVELYHDATASVAAGA